MRKKLLPAQTIENKILYLRDQRIILDVDLARIYGVETRVLNQAVKRNRAKFPADFMFQLTAAETETWKLHLASDGGRGMRSQIVIASGKRNIRHFPLAFTEHGAIMAATVLNSPNAVKMSVFVVRAFIKMRGMLMAQYDFARKLKDLEKKLTSRLNIHEHAISDIIKQIMQLLNPPAEPEIVPQKEIGFHVREPHTPYGIKKQHGRK